MIKLNIQRFSSTNKTTHYDLSQYVSSDLPTYLVDYNSDMSKIDTGINTAQTTADTASTAASNAQTAAETASTTATTAITNAATAQTTADGAVSNIGTLANLDTVNKANLVGAINEVNTSAVSSANILAGMADKVIEVLGSTYIKFADGLMLCWGAQTGTNAENAAYFGVCYRTEWITSTFPQTFISAPIVVETCNISGILGNTEGTITTTGFETRILTASNDTGLTYTIDYIAIGRWK